MSSLERLLQWASGNGIVMRGIQPTKTSRHGTGIVATRALKAGEVVLEVPPQVVRCLNTVAPAVRQPLPPDMPIHGLLAASLVLEDAAPSAWKAVLPSAAALEAGMPCLWPPQLQALLPPDARTALLAQTANLERQWALVSHAFPHVARADFQHAWLLVNSRSFLDGSPETQSYPWADRLALVPVADLFNHGEVGAAVHNVAPDGGYLVSADRAYRAGEEVLIVYGNHTDDFMLVEYGFILGRGDDVCLDDWIVPRLGEAHRAQLDSSGWLGGFPLSAEAEDAHRTQAALHLLCCSPDACGHFSAAKGKGECQGKVDAYMVGLLEGVLADISATLGRLGGLEVAVETQRSLLQRRWRRIASAVELRIEQLREGDA